MWHATELQAMEDEADRCYQEGVDLCMLSDMAIGFPLLELEV